eukprot:1161575-Pelagomonas_calceolata.AAC.3
MPGRMHQSCTDSTGAVHVNQVYTHELKGMVKPGDEVEIMGLRDPIKTTVTGVEMFKKSLGQGQVCGFPRSTV